MQPSPCRISNVSIPLILKNSRYCEYNFWKTFSVETLGYHQVET